MSLWNWFAKPPPDPWTLDYFRRLEQAWAIEYRRRDRGYRRGLQKRGKAARRCKAKRV